MRFIRRGEPNSPGLWVLCTRTRGVFGAVHKMRRDWRQWRHIDLVVHQSRSHHPKPPHETISRPLMPRGSARGSPGSPPNKPQPPEPQPEPKSHNTTIGPRPRIIKCFRESGCLFPGLWTENTTMHHAPIAPMLPCGYPPIRRALLGLCRLAPPPSCSSVAEVSSILYSDPPWHFFQ